jgi:hypothetical protein
MNHRKLLTSFVSGMEAAVMALLLILLRQVRRFADRWLFPVALSTVASPRQMAWLDWQVAWQAIVGAGAVRNQSLCKWSPCVLAAALPHTSCWTLPTIRASALPQAGCL